MACLCICVFTHAANRFTFAPVTTVMEMAMFVRVIWRKRPAPEYRQTLREMDEASSRVGDCLGLASPDFTAMTRSVFGR
jgi:hypothetical protein